MVVPSNSASSSSLVAGARSLQESLHILLSSLASTIEHVKNWPEAKGDDASIHVESTSKLIAHIYQVIAALKKVEGVVKTDTVLRKSLQECQIPLDLLDLLDSNLNPDCFLRGLLREAAQKQAGLKRRKRALEMLSAAVQSSLDKRLADSGITAHEGGGNTGSKKRPRSNDGVTNSETESPEPARKKQHMSDEAATETT